MRRVIGPCLLDMSSVSRQPEPGRVGTGFDCGKRVNGTSSRKLLLSRASHWRER